MKKIFVSIGAAAIGAGALPLAQAQPVSLSPQESTKPWSVALALRGFYDDNYTYAARDSGDVRDSFGFQVRPTVGLNMPLEQTYIGLDFTYIGDWYEDRSSDEAWDHSFLVNGMVSHSFTERMNLEVSDQFVYSQRPELTDPNLGTFRTDSNNINNRGNVQYSLGLSPRLGLVLGYENLFWDYEDDNASAETTPPASTSLSAELDRMEHLIPVNLRHQTGPSTVTFVGYNYGIVGYTSDEFLYSGVPYGIPSPKADSRDYSSHYGYVGVEHNFTPLLNLGVRGGAQYSDFQNSPTSETTLTPYGDLSLSYLYTVGSTMEVGYTLSQAATDQVTPDASGNPTLNRLVSSVYARVDHQFTPQLHGGLFGQWQYSVYNGGAYDSQNDNLYLLGASLRYKFNQFLAGDLGYTFDYLDSDIVGRGYTRNRVYVGVTASY
ncbi:MAG: outer membrane beta-barrel protein [Verrucomicrobia bacterium]|jgi:hypothetical protein|nr:outer membrane beta-barrel protein [Verrucomicrobiota bacterium]